MNINVIQEDIDHGKKTDPTGCAIARAIRRQCNVEEVSVNTYSISISGKKYKTSVEMGTFIHKFDVDKKLVFPTEFLLDTSKEVEYV